MIKIVDDCFTLEECESFIVIGESIGFSQAKCTFGDRDETEKNSEIDLNIRDSLRCEYNSKEFTDMIFEKISKHYPGLFKGINQNVRFLKYNPGQKFKKHHDAPRMNDTREYTFVIYLSDCVGGETVVYDFEPYPDKKIESKTGRMLIFDKGLLHSGEKVVSGVKYVIVGDLYNIDKKRSPSPPDPYADFDDDEDDEYWEIRSRPNKSNNYGKRLMEN